MTRIIFLPDEKTVIVTESSVPAGRLAEGLNRGQINLGLLAGRAPGEKLLALASGSLVIVLAGEMLAAEASGETPELNWRQRLVLRALVEGLGTKQIAAQLGVTPRTVYIYVAGLKAALGVKTRAQIVQQGIARGILDIKP